MMDLRKVAIVVSSLDRETADRLLEEMPDAQAKSIRDAMMTLEEASDVEAKQAIAEFLEVQSNGGVGSLTSVAMVPKVDARATLPGSTRPRGERLSVDVGPDASPIQRASERLIADCLHGELPQAIAVALTDLPAHRASEVVSYLPATLQAEVLERMVELAPDAQLESSEVRDEFRSWLNEQIEHSLRRVELANRLATILNATHKRARERIMHNVASSDAQLAKELELQLSQTGTFDESE